MSPDVPSLRRLDFESAKKADAQINFFNQLFQLGGFAKRRGQEEDFKFDRKHRSTRHSAVEPLDSTTWRSNSNFEFDEDDQPKIDVMSSKMMQRRENRQRMRKLVRDRFRR